MPQLLQLALVYLHSATSQMTHHSPVSQAHHPNMPPAHTDSAAVSNETAAIPTLAVAAASQDATQTAGTVHIQSQAQPRTNLHGSICSPPFAMCHLKLRCRCIRLSSRRPRKEHSAGQHGTRGPKVQSILGLLLQQRQSGPLLQR